VPRSPETEAITITYVISQYSCRRLGCGLERRRRERHERAQGPGAGLRAPVSLDRAQMQVEDRLVDLTPGMAVTVEIKTGSRRVIE